MSKRVSRRVAITVSREMIVALEMLATKTGLAVTTQAMVLLRQALDRTISSDAVQLRLKQEQAFRSRDEWLQDQQSDTFVASALLAAEGEGADVPPR